MMNARCLFSDCFFTARALFATPRNGGPKPYSKDPIKVSADPPRGAITNSPRYLVHISCITFATTTT
jgi:hypothetical protein